jgi:hypothetical protein
VVQSEQCANGAAGRQVVIITFVFIDAIVFQRTSDPSREWFVIWRSGDKQSRGQDTNQIARQFLGSLFANFLPDQIGSVIADGTKKRSHYLVISISYMHQFVSEDAYHPFI